MTKRVNGVVKKVGNYWCLTIEDKNFLIHTWDREKFKSLRVGCSVIGLIFEYKTDYGSKDKKIQGYVYPGTLTIIESSSIDSSDKQKEKANGDG